MAKPAQYMLDAAKPFYAWVGAAEVAVERLRVGATGVQERVERLDRDPKVLAAQARTQVGVLFDELTQEYKKAHGRLESLSGEAEARVERIQDEVRALPAALRADLAKLLAERREAFEELATRGQSVIAKLRDDSISGDVEIIDPDADVVKDVPVDVEKAAAEAAAAASTAATAAVAEAATDAVTEQSTPGRASTSSSAPRKRVARKAPAGTRPTA